jgi:D-alanine-D-alanine ligase
VLGNHGAELFALTPIEICPDAGRFFDYEQKYSERGARELCPPQNVSQAAWARVRELSLSAHSAAGCDGYSRTDFIVPIDEGGEREPVMLEVKPGMTALAVAVGGSAAG